MLIVVLLVLVRHENDPYKLISVCSVLPSYGVSLLTFKPTHKKHSRSLQESMFEHEV